MFTLRLLIGTSGASGREDMRLTYIPSAPSCFLVKFPLNPLQLRQYRIISARKIQSLGKPVIWKKEYFEILLKKKIGYSRSFPGKPGLFQIMNTGHPSKQHDFPELVKDGRRWGKNLMAYAGKQ